MTKQTYYITTAIAYTSGKPHIGNIYEIVLADSIARYRRQQGLDVYFMTGTDEHGRRRSGRSHQRSVRFDEHQLRQIHPHHRPLT
jgi:methionyl-tRNA synthetase